MGTPPAYRIMRSEDVSWIQEAARERIALATGGGNPRVVMDVPEFGRWGLGATNGFRSWVTATFYENGGLTTNIIARYSQETNNVATTIMRIGYEPGHADGADFRLIDESYIAGYLDPSAATISSPQVVELANGSWPVITNVTETVTTNWSGYYRDEEGWHRSETTKVTYVTMAMTNGTTVVHTNKWTVITPHEERNSITNVSQMSWESMVFMDCSPNYLKGESPPLKGMFRASVITNCYPILRDAKRALKQAHFGTVENTSVYASSDRWSDESEEEPFSTNATVRTEDWRGTCSKTFIASHLESSYEEAGEDGTWYTIYDKSGRIDALGTPSGNITAIIDLNIQDWVVFTGGVQRVETVEVFAGFRTEYDEYDYASDGSKNTNNVKKAVLIKVGETSSITHGDGDENGQAVCSIGFNAVSLCNSAMAASGHAFPSFGWYPDLQYPTPYPGSSISMRTYSASLVWLGVVLHVNPWTSLPGW